MRPPLSPNAWLRYGPIRRAIRTAGSPRNVLEVGCGGGGLATRLAADYEYVGYESDSQSCSLASERLARLGTGRALNKSLPVQPEGAFDVVCAFEVLEHIEDDAGALERWAQWLRPGGVLVLSVPAHQSRFGPWDEAVGHYRRYSRSGLEDVLNGARLVNPQVRSYGFPLGYALEFARNRLAAPRRSESMQERTARSGRLLQPTSAFGAPLAVGVGPFRLFQRAFERTNLGTGFVAWATLSR